LQNYNSEINNNFTIFKTNYEEQENLLKNKINDKQLEIEHLETEHKNKINYLEENINNLKNVKIKIEIESAKKIKRTK
jgi:hypothetical protein